MNTQSGHPITVAAERSGLSQDVLRVWERRYGAVQPSRDATGQRVYSDADIARLRLLRAVTRAGRSIRTVAGLPDAELERLASEDASARKEQMPAAPGPDVTAAVARAMEWTRQLATDELQAELRRAHARFGLFVFLEHVLAPLLRQIGEAWHARELSPAQEHVASALIYGLIAESMRSFNAPAGAPTMVVATLSGEPHVIGAAMTAATAVAEGWRVVFLGADLPVDDIALAVERAHAEALALSIVLVEERRRIASDLARLRARCASRVKIVTGGAGAPAIGLPEGVTHYPTLDELRAGLQNRFA